MSQSFASVGAVITNAFMGKTNLPTVARQASGAIGSLARAYKEMERYDNQTANRAERERVEMRRAVGGAISGVGIPMAALAGMTQSVRLAANLEEQLQRVQIVAADLGQTNTQLSNTFLDISATTGIAAQQLAVVAEVMGTSGLVAGFADARTDPAEAMRAFVDTAAKFSVVAKQTPLVAARQLADLTLQLRLFEGGPQKMKRFVSALQVVGKNSASNAKQVAEFTKALVPLFNQFEESQLSIPEILAVAGAVRSFGGEVTKSLIKTNVAGVFATMAKNSEKFADFLEMSPQSFITKKNNEPFKVFVMLLQKLADMRGDQQKFSNTLRELGLSSKRIQPLLAGATRQIQLMVDLADKAKSAYSGAVDVLEKDFRKAMDGLNKQLSRMWQILNGIKIAFGREFLGALTLIVKAVNLLGTGLLAFLVTPLGRLVSIVGGLLAFSFGLNAVGAALGWLKSIFGVGGFFAPFLKLFEVALIGNIFGDFMIFMTVTVALLDQLFKRLIGPGTARAIESLQMLFDAFFKLARGQRITMSAFKELQSRGLDKFLFAMITIFKTIKDLFVGLGTGFEAGFSFIGSIIDTISEGVFGTKGIGLGTGIRFMLEQIAMLMGVSAEGIPTLELFMRMFTKFIGVVTGGAVGGLLASLFAIVDALAALVGMVAWFIRKGAEFIPGMKKWAGLLMILAGGLLSTSLAGALVGIPLIMAGLGLVGSSVSGGSSLNATPGSLPVTGTLGASKAGADIIGQLPFIRGQLGEGVEAGPGGRVLEATFKTPLEISGAKLAEVLAVVRERDARRAGKAPSPTGYDASSLPGMASL